MIIRSRIVALPCSDTSSPGNNRGRCSSLVGRLQSPCDAFHAQAQVGYLFGAVGRLWYSVHASMEDCPVGIRPTP